MMWRRRPVRSAARALGRRASVAAWRVLLSSCAAAGWGCTTVRPESAPAQEVLGSSPDPASLEGPWQALLTRYVDGEGRVDYAAVDRAALERLYASVAASSPERHPERYPTRAAQLAYYLNAYNILVWKSVLMRLPGLRNLGTVRLSFFGLTKFVIGGDSWSLHGLEKHIRATFKEPRAHFALNCASAGCPKLPAEAFTASRLDAQLDRETRKFVSERRNVELAPQGGTVRLSSIFDWYRDDFAADDRGLVRWINRCRAADVQVPIAAAITHRAYDWRLNDRSLARD